jgi:ribose transport system ATP-binding protein
MQVIDGLRRDGVAVIYISHRLAEVKRIADRVTVLRDGANAGELAREEVSHDSLVRLMVGRDLKQLYPRTADRQPGPVRLEVRNLLYPGGSDTPMSFALRAGEVVGVAGLVGAGRTELAETLFGVRRRRAGEVLLDGTPVRLGTPADAVAAGVLLVPEDRRLFGLVLDFPVRTNLSLPSLGRLNTLGIVSRAREKTLARDLIARLRVKTPSASQAVGLLSGGNQQKVVLGKWLARDPKVLILDEPTRGVDVGARSEIYAIMDDLANQGVAVLMISSDLEEVLGMSDRVLVLHEGRLAGELARSELGEEAVMHLATGGKR